MIQAWEPPPFWAWFEGAEEATETRRASAVESWPWVTTWARGTRQGRVRHLGRPGKAPRLGTGLTLDLILTLILTLNMNLIGKVPRLGSGRLMLELLHPAVESLQHALPGGVQTAAGGCDRLPGTKSCSGVLLIKFRERPGFGRAPPGRGRGIGVVAPWGLAAERQFPGLPSWCPRHRGAGASHLRPRCGYSGSLRVAGGKGRA